MSARKKRPALATPAPNDSENSEPASSRRGLVLVKSPDSLEKRLAFDLVGVLEGEVPNVDAAVVGLEIVSEALRRRGQEGRAWGDRGSRGAA